MLKFTDFFKQSPQNKLSLKNNTQLAYKGAWIQVYPDTVIDRWYVGDYSSANYTITVEFDSNKKEVLQVLIVARPDQASVTVFGRTSIDDSLVNITATVNDSYVDVIANATDTTFIGSKLIFYAMYAETITPLTISEATSFVDSTVDGGGGTGGGGGGGGGATSFSELSGQISLGQIPNTLITPAKLNLSASLLPTTDVTYDLGSASYRWKDLYLSGSSINLGSATITATGSAINLPAGTTIGGSSVSGFSTVEVSGQSNIVADSAGDTLTFVAGPGIAITTSAGTDTVTITNTGSGGGGGGGVSAGTATRLAYYASTGSVVQDTGANLTWSGTNLNVTGTITATGAVSYVRAYFDTLVELTAVSPSTWHGMVAHVHETGRMYFAHAGAWAPLANYSDLNIFSTIAVAGQTSVVADSATDTLTLVGAGGITITTNATTDTITITGSGGGGTLDSLSDVVITSPTTNQVLKYDGSNWVNGTDATGGGGATSDSFTTIAVAGQSNVVADSSTDTLTLVASTGISITTNASTDTITIASTVSSGATAFTGLSDISTSGLTVDKIYLPAITVLDVTANGSSAYRFDQYGTADDPTIYAISGTTIAFNLAGASGHPFLIQTSAGSNYDTGLVHVTTTGTVATGSSAQAKQSGTLYWKIPAGTTGNYRYQCAAHGAMFGVITIKDISAI
jgi:plastocyanin